MFKKLIFIAVLTFFSFTGYAGRMATHGHIAEHGYNFWLAEPEDTTEAKPVVIFLHGSSLCGNNLEKVKRYGTIDAIERGREIDAYVIAPQNPGGSWQPEKIMEILEWVEANYNVDSNKVYVLGMSLGGYGTLDFTATYPDKVAAAMAMCGGSTVKDVTCLNDVPLWIVHGIADNRVSIAKSDRIVAAMKEADPNVPRLIYDRVPGMNHSRPARIFYLPETYDWLLSHSLDDKNRPVSEGFDVSEESLQGAYSGLNYSNRTYRHSAEAAPNPYISTKKVVKSSSKTAAKSSKSKSEEKASKKSDRKKSDNKKSDNKKCDNKKSDGKKSDSKKSDNKKSDNKKSDNKKADSKKSDSKKGDTKLAAKNSDRKSSSNSKKKAAAKAN